MKAICPLLFAVGALLLSSAASADSLRCDGSKLRNEARYYECCSRCDHGERGPECDIACKARRDSGMIRIALSAVCASDSEPDPMLCRAEVLRTQAAAMFCKSRCTRRGNRSEAFDQTECEQECDADFDDALADACASPVCATHDTPECMPPQ